jgi:hypothetical protein
MDFQLTYDDHRQLFVVTTTGPLAQGGINMIIGALVDHPAWGRGRPLLLDHTESPADHLGAAGLRALTDYDLRNARLIGDISVAMVVGSDLDLGLARMWEALVAGQVPYEVCVFRDRTAAERWLLERSGARAPARDQGS